MSYYEGQTLVHKKKRFLARLATKNDGPFHFDTNQNGTDFILENGKKLIADINEFDCVKNEWGTPYSEPVEKGQYVDVSAKKYLVNNRKLAGMREKTLRKIRAAAKPFTEQLIQTLLLSQTKLNKIRPPRTPQMFGSSRFKLEIKFDELEPYNRFSFNCYEAGDIQFFTPTVSRYFDYTKYLISFLKKNKWKVTTLKIKTRNKYKGGYYLICLFAQKNGKTIYYNQSDNSHITLTKISR